MFLFFEPAKVDIIEIYYSIFFLLFLSTKNDSSCFHMVTILINAGALI